MDPDYFERETDCKQSRFLDKTDAQLKIESRARELSVTHEMSILWASNLLPKLFKIVIFFISLFYVHVLNTAQFSALCILYFPSHAKFANVRVLRRYDHKQDMQTHSKMYAWFTNKFQVHRTICDIVNRILFNYIKSLTVELVLYFISTSWRNVRRVLIII